MKAKVEFFYDYVSTYSYLANSQLAKLDAEIIYRPMFLGAVMEETGNRPPLTVKPKGKYLFVDVARWARKYSIPFEKNPKFPQNTVKALRLALVAGPPSPENRPIPEKGLPWNPSPATVVIMPVSASTFRIR